MEASLIFCNDNKAVVEEFLSAASKFSPNGSTGLGGESAANNK